MKIKESDIIKQIAVVAGVDRRTVYHWRKARQPLYEIVKDGLTFQSLKKQLKSIDQTNAQLVIKTIYDFLVEEEVPSNNS